MPAPGPTALSAACECIGSSPPPRSCVRVARPPDLNIVFARSPHLSIVFGCPVGACFPKGIRYVCRVAPTASEFCDHLGCRERPVGRPRLGIRRRNRDGVTLALASHLDRHPTSFAWAVWEITIQTA